MEKEHQEETSAEEIPLDPFEEVAFSEIGTDAPDVSQTPLWTPSLLKTELGKVGTVEVNLSNGSAWIMPESEAPVLTGEILREKGAPVQQVPVYKEGVVSHIWLYHGMPLSLILEWEDLQKAEGEAKDFETTVQQLILSRMIVEPKFTFRGKAAPSSSGSVDTDTSLSGEGMPIEDLDSYLEVFWKAHLSLNNSSIDDIYQVQVRKVTPLEVGVMLQDSFEAYNTGGGKPSDASYADREARDLAEKRILATSTVLLPITSLNGEDHRPDTEKSPEDVTPIEDLSVTMLRTLHNAYKAYNVPEAGERALRMFQRMGNRNRVGTKRSD